MQVGIIGLPNVGKSTIFNALTSANAAVANYPFCTIDPNAGQVNVPDKNLVGLANIYDSKKITNSSIKILDVAGLVKGASKGEGLGNMFLSHIREVDVVVHIVRCFEDGDIPHSSLQIDPVDDIETIETELILADLEMLEKKKEGLSSLLKAQDQGAKENSVIIDLLIKSLNSGEIPEALKLKEKYPEFLTSLGLFILKPSLIVANLGEEKGSEVLYRKLIERFENRKNIIKVYGKLEKELTELQETEREEYRKEMGIPEGGLDDFISVCYRMLDLITFYTINENETRAWPIRAGSSVIEAAGKIHTDMQRGFIKAEVIDCSTLLEHGSIHRAREEGRVRIEGRDYIVKDEDVVQIRFAV